ncbi:hypothetical protein Dimus_006618 [Dionaea muscipula]
MEDAIAMELGFAGKPPRRFDYFAVFDGHGGAEVAAACRERVHLILAGEIRREVSEDDEGGGRVDWERVMLGCFEKMDEEVAGLIREDGEGKEAVLGSTAAAAAVVGAEEIVVANCGDSRAVLCRGGVATRLSVDHKPDRPDELARIEAAGGKVMNWNGEARVMYFPLQGP